MNFEAVRTPAKIAFEGDDLSVVAAVGPVSLLPSSYQIRVEK